MIDEWKAEVNARLKEYNDAFEAVKIRAALALVMQIGGLGNKLLQSNTLDNKTFAAEPDKIRAVVGTGINLVHLLACIIRPFMPATSASILSQLKVEDHLIPDKWTGDSLKPGHKISDAKRLFEPIKAEKEQEWREQFGGDEVRREKEEKARKAEARKRDKEKKKAKKAAAKDGPAGESKDDKSVDKLAAKVEDLQT